MLPGQPVDEDEGADRLAIVQEMAEALGRAIDAKDPFTKNHSNEVAAVARALALTMGLAPRQAAIIHIAGHLHDIGKIGAPDAILRKKTALTKEEWQLIKKHPETGAAILAPVKAMEQMGVPRIVLCHHEWFDGSGYPGGLSGSAIPLGARIIAVADNLSAMLQSRPYREAIDFDDTCREIKDRAGIQFDPEAASALWENRKKMRRILQGLNDKSEAAFDLDPV